MNEKGPFFLSINLFGASVDTRSVRGGSESVRRVRSGPIPKGALVLSFKCRKKDRHPPKELIVEYTVVCLWFFKMMVELRCQL